MQSNKDIFGNPEKYKTLVFISQEVATLDKNKRQYISLFIYDFNRTCNRMQEISDVLLLKYVKKLVYEDYINRINKLSEKYNPELLSRIKNYFNARIGNIKQDIKISKRVTNREKINNKSKL